MSRMKLLFAAGAAAMMALGAFGADKTAKAVYENNNKTLRFVYDSNSYGTKGSQWFSVAEAEEGSYTSWAPWNAARTTVTKVVFDNSFADYKPKHFSYWFWGFDQLASVVGTECLDISEAESFRSMFEDCSSLVSVDLGKCITGNAKATTMYRMFSGCSNLELVQLRGLCTDTVTDMQYMFQSCEKLQKIYASDDFVTANANGSSMFGGCERLTGGNGTTFSSTYRNKERACIDRPGAPGYFTVEPCAKVVPSADGKTLRFTYDSADCGTRGTDWYSVAAACEIEHGTVKPWRNGYWNTATKVVIEPNFYDFHPRTCDGWFNNFSSVANFEGLRYLNVSEATTLTDLFRGCSAVRTLDLSTFNTAKATSIAAMFNACSSLATIYVSDKFTTSQIGSSNLVSDVFYGCSSSLVGGNGTRYTGATGTSSGRYACVDTANNPGYFTLQTETAKVVVESSGRVLRFVYDSEDYGTKGVDWFPLWDVEAWGANYDPAWCTTSLRSSVVKVTFDESFAQYKPRRCSCWFNGFSSLSVVDGLENLDTSGAVSFAFMFSQCRALSRLDLGGFDTRSLTDMNCMFAGCERLTEVQLDHFTTDKVTCMNQTFCACVSLTTIYALADFSLAALPDSSCGFDMFERCDSLAGANGTSWNGLRTSCRYAKIDRQGTEGFLTLAPTAKAVPSADRKTLRFVYDNLDYGTKDTDWYSVDETCAHDILTVPTWYDESFYATNIVIEKSFAKYRPTSCESWFLKFNHVEEIDGLCNLDVSRAVRMTSMFEGCDKLKVLDLSRFDTANAQSIAYMFNACTNLVTIYASDRFVTSNLISPSSNVFGGNLNLVGGNGTAYSDSHRNAGYAHLDQQYDPGYFSVKPTAKAVLKDNGATLEFVYDNLDHGVENVDWFALPDEDWSHSAPPWEVCGYSVTKVVFAPSFAVCRPTDMGHWFYNFENLTRIDGLENLFTSEVTNMAYMFYNCSRLQSVDLGYFDTSKVTDMEYMFSDCSSLTTIRASAAFTTAALGRTNNHMFYHCDQLRGGMGTDYEDYYDDGAAMARIDDRFGVGGGFFTESKRATAFFDPSVGSLTFCYDGIDRRLWDVKLYSVAEAESRPQRAVDISDLPPWWNDCHSNVVLVEFDASFKNYQPRHCADWFYIFYNLEEIVGLENLDVSWATSLYEMFYGCSSLLSLDLSGFNTSRVTDMDYMFYDCPYLKTIYVGHGFTTANLTNPQNSMFFGCSRLVGGNGTVYSALQIGSAYARVDIANTPGYFSRKREAVAVLEDNATTLVFYYDTVDHYDDGPNFLLDEVGELDPGTRPDWSIGAGTVTEIVFDYSFADYRVKHCGNWFSQFSALEKLTGMENLDVSEATDLRFMFQWCQNLRIIDFSGFDTSSVTNMHGMFHYCTGVKRIYVSDEFTTAALDNPNEMVFKLSVNLVTDNGTKWNSSNDSAAYARIDGGASAPGYFSVKKPAVAVYSRNGSRLSFYCDGLDHSGEGVVYSVLDTEDAPLVPRFVSQLPMWIANNTVVSQVVFDASFAAYRPLNCAGWFYGFSEVETFEGLENLNTSGVSSMAHMFDGCSKVKVLDLSGFETGATLYTRYMFNGCTALTTIYASEAFDNLFDPDELQCSMFDGCVNLAGDCGTAYDENRVTFEYAILDGGANAPGYFSLKQTPPVAVYAAATKTLTFYCDGLDHSNEGVVYSVKASEDLDESNTVPEWFNYSQSITNAVFDASFAAYQPRSCRNWFYDFNYLKAVNGLENLDTSKVVDMYGMFMQCSVIKTLDLSRFNTSNVTNMNSMFSCCMMIEALDVSSFDTRKVRDMSEMFYNCWALTTIYAYEFSTVGVCGTDRGADMFTYSDRLVGGNGTRYSGDHVDYTYACIDLPQDITHVATPGYFTYKAPALSGYAAWAAEQGLVGDDAAWDAKPSKWGGEWENALIYTFGEGLKDGTTILLDIKVDAYGLPVVTTAPANPEHDDFNYVVIGTTDLSDWSSAVELVRNGNDWTLPPGIAANYFRLRLTK